MTAEDIHAFTPARPVTSAPPPRRSWPWVLGAVLLALLLTLAVAGAVGVALAGAAGHGWHVVINGDEWTPHAVGAGHWVVALLGVGAAVVIVMLVVPFALLLAFLGVALGLGIALLAVALVVAVALSPLWLFGWLLWLLLRRPGHRKPAPAATMAA